MCCLAPLNHEFLGAAPAEALGYVPGPGARISISSCGAQWGEATGYLRLENGVVVGDDGCIMLGEWLDNDGK